MSSREGTGPFHSRDPTATTNNDSNPSSPHADGADRKPPSRTAAAVAAGLLPSFKDQAQSTRTENEPQQQQQPIIVSEDAVPSAEGVPVVMVEEEEEEPAIANNNNNNRSTDRKHVIWAVAVVLIVIVVAVVVTVAVIVGGSSSSSSSNNDASTDGNMQDPFASPTPTTTTTTTTVSPPAVTVPSSPPSPPTTASPTTQPPMPEEPTSVRPLSETTKLLANDGGVADSFGNSVAISGDTMVVAAFQDNDNGDDSGSAYIYIRSGTTWTQQTKLTASDGAIEDLFGVSVAISGDTTVVGAWGDDCNNGDLNCGSVYIYVRSGTTWTQQAKLTASDGAAFDSIGFRVAIAGDTMVVGSPFDDCSNGALDCGSAYIYVRSGTTWTEEAMLTASDGAADDQLGAVAISGDTLVVGTPFDDCSNGALDCGSAYIYVRSGIVWAEQAKINASDGASDDIFGYSLAISGDTIIVGTPGNIFATDTNNTLGGSAYIYIRSGSSWTQQAKLLASDGAANDTFGESVAISGDTVVVGADNDGDNGTNSGSAYVYIRSGTTWTEQAKLTASDGATDDFFGLSVAIDGAILVLGAAGDDDNGSSSGSGSGSAYVFDLNQVLE